MKGTGTGAVRKPWRTPWLRRIPRKGPARFDCTGVNCQNDPRELVVEFVSLDGQAPCWMVKDRRAGVSRSVEYKTAYNESDVLLCDSCAADRWFD